MTLFDSFVDALEEAEFLATEEKKVYAIDVVGEQYEVRLAERRGKHNKLEMSGRRSGRKTLRK